jgi:8-oxo-dGTP diphosphatase/2-hydroxy-dATP diphosphatase
MAKKNRKIFTLSIPHDHPRVLLGMKKRGFGAGRWNGFGGKVEPGESVEQAAKRELFEESGIAAAEIEQFGLIEFEFQGSPEILEVHIFKITDFAGDGRESDEMSPRWFFVDEIPFSEMWPDDVHWFPFFLSGRKFKGRFLFGKDDVILEKELAEVKNL